MKTANDLAVKFLQYAERTEAELRLHLIAKGIRKEEIDQVVGSMTALSYVSDARVAEREIDLAKTERKIGKEKVKARLISRGTDEAAVEQAVAAYDQETEIANAMAFLSAKKYVPSDAAKAARALVARGFSEETCSSALSRYFPEIDW